MGVNDTRYVMWWEKIVCDTWSDMPWYMLESEFEMWYVDHRIRFCYVFLLSCDTSVKSSRFVVDCDNAYWEANV